jgi:hypothetical protein
MDVIASRPSAGRWRIACRRMIKPIARSGAMLKPIRLACVTNWLLLMYGCQSRVVAVGYQPPLASAAWFMALREPNLTPRLLNELSLSPVTGTKD